MAPAARRLDAVSRPAALATVEACELADTSWTLHQLRTL